MSWTSGRPVPDKPGPGQESVWDYPRPPRLEALDAAIDVVLGGQVVARTDRALRVLETSHPPTYYLPRACFADGVLRPADGGSYCEWKGQASYLDVVGGTGGTGGAGGAGNAQPVVASRAAWFYPQPSDAYADLLDHVALYPGLMERCTVDGEVVVAQPGGFYGGWVTSAVTGPFKGEPGTMWW